MRYLTLVLVALTACSLGGVTVSESFSQVGVPAPAGQGALGPQGVQLPPLTVLDDRGGSLLVDPFTWAEESAMSSSSGSGARAPEHYRIQVDGLSVTLVTPYPNVQVFLTHNDDGRVETSALVPEKLDDETFEIRFPQAGTWVVDVFCLLGSSYAAYAFTVEVLG